jgi:hypothetical protein
MYSYENLTKYKITGLGKKKTEHVKIFRNTRCDHWPGNSKLTDMKIPQAKAPLERQFSKTICKSPETTDPCMGWQ